MYEVSVNSMFSAAHSLRYYKGKCEKLHGHNWKVELVMKGERLKKTGIVCDFTELKKILKKIISVLDHKYLNEIPAFNKTNPTSENIAKYIYDSVKCRVPDAKLRISRVKVWESDTSSATYIP
jgi:6-pyruvoyltetrahydropterin/6-carboxytetrahydropterin synthase